jgi:hypothetical protein
LRYRRRVALLTALALPALAVVLYHFPPIDGSIYPKCVFYWATGLHCPGCGTARCLHSLLHGDLAQAASYNVLTLLALPWLLAVGLHFVLGAALGWKPSRRLLPAWAIWLLFVVVVAFWVLRNVNVAPFNWLAPHRL